MKQPTPAQQATAAARRDRIRTLAADLAAMTDDQRAALADRIGAVVTIEGHPLSVGNTMMLAMQMPTATVVGGFRQWKRAGRQVAKGQHGAGIWVPLKGRQDAADPEDSQYDDPAETVSTSRPRFTLGTVFDVSQTEPAGAPAEAEVTA